MLGQKGRSISIQLLREARTRQNDSRWLGSAGTVRLQRYQGKYVAVKNRRIVAASSTMRGLYKRLDKLDTGMVLIARVEKPALLVYAEFF